MAHVAAHDDVRSTGGSQCQIPVVLRIVALPHGFGRFDPLGCDDDNVKDALATFDSDEAVELRAEDNLTIFVLDRLREKQPVRRAHGA